MTLNVKITGIERLRSKLSDEGIGRALRPALRQAGLIVQEAAQHNVHSPDNPYIGKAGHSVATGRLQASIGTSDVTGSGLALEVRVGTPYGKGGLARGTFARSSRSTRSGRTGDRRNRGDVRIYGPIEEAKHPFLKPALERNVERIRSILVAALGRAWR